MQMLPDARSGPTPTRATNEIVLVVLLALSAGLVFLDRLGIAYVFPQLRSELRLSNAELGSLMSVTALTWAISSILFSFLSDRLGGRPKLIILFCMTVFSLVTGAMGLVASFAGLIAARTLMGVFEGPMMPMIQSSVAAVSPPSRLGRNLGIVIAGTTLLGNALPPLVMAGLATAFGWRGSFLLLSVPGLMLALALFFAMPSDARPDGREEHDRPSFRDAARLLSERNVVLGAIGAATLIGFTIAFSAFLPLFLNDQPAMTPGARIAVLTAFGISGTVGAVLAPWLSDRFPRKRCLLIATACQAIAAGLVTQAPSHPWLFVPVIVINLVGSGALTLMMYVIPGESVPPRLTATTFALLIAFGEIVGGSTAPTLAGMIADLHGLETAIWFSSGLAGLSLVTALGMREPPRRLSTASSSSAEAASMY